VRQEAFQREIREILGISEETVAVLPPEMESSFYAVAFENYELGNYRMAAQLFTQLVLTNPFSEHYWQGLAGAKQMAREYEAALHAWGLLALLREGDPLIHFHAAECLLALHDKEEGAKALQAALELCKDGELLEQINALKTVHDV
jgi:type III secretion system low calcium response chaperone LcrH/SycD